MQVPSPCGLIPQRRRTEASTPHTLRHLARAGEPPSAGHVEDKVSLTFFGASPVVFTQQSPCPGGTYVSFYLALDPANVDVARCSHTRYEPTRSISHQASPPSEFPISILGWPSPTPNQTEFVAKKHPIGYVALLLSLGLEELITTTSPHWPLCQTDLVDWAKSLPATLLFWPIPRC